LWLPLQLNLIKLEQRQMEIEWVAGTCGLLGRVPHDIATAKVTLPWSKCRGVKSGRGP